MRVLFLANSAHIGGGNRSLLTLWDELSRRGHELTATAPTTGPLLDEAAKRDVPIEVVPYAQPGWRQPLESASCIRRWRRLLRRARPDVVHANGLHGARSISVAARIAHLPVVVHVRFGMLKRRQEFMQWAYRGMPKPQRFILNSHSLLEEMEPHLERASPTTARVVVHNPISLSAFTPRRAHTDDPPRVGIIANLLPVKGHRDFLQMARLLRERGSKASYYIAGADVREDRYGERLRGECRGLGLDDIVQFLGHVEDVAALLQTLDVVVCPSHVEPFGRCVAEAMSCQVPVVATSVGGLPEVVAEGVTGYLVPVGEPPALADRVAELFADPGLRQRMGEAGRERVQQLFSTDLHADRILAIYREVTPQLET